MRQLRRALSNAVGRLSVENVVHVQRQPDSPDLLTAAIRRRPQRRAPGRDVAPAPSIDLSVLGLLRKLARHHRPTYEHSHRLARLAEQVAADLCLPAPRVRLIQHVGLMHDIGKLAVERRLLDLDGPLDDAQRAVMHQHTIAGEALLEPIPVLRSLGRLVRATHERWDGGGYPDGLRGESIPFEARVVACADAFDAMVSDRAYRDALAPCEARRRVAADAGRQFDPQVARALLRVTASR